MYQKMAAEKAVRKVSGVKAVIENLEVHLPTCKQKSDLPIADEILPTPRWHTAIADGKIKVLVKLKVLVKHGFVTLSGQVPGAMNEQWPKLQSKTSRVYGL